MGVVLDLEMLINAPVDRGGDDVESSFLNSAEGLHAGSEHVLVCDGASERVKVFHQSVKRLSVMNSGRNEKRTFQF